MATITANSIRQDFTTEVLTRLHAPGQAPTFQSMQQGLSELLSNAGSVETDIGDGRDGHAGLVNDPTFERPPKPPLEPVYAANATQAARESTRTNWELAFKRHRTYICAEKALRKQLLEAVDERYVRALKDRVHRYDHCTVYEIVAHLKKRYGKIAKAALKANTDRMQAHWDPATDIDILYEQIEKGRDYAEAGGAPFNPVQIVNMAYNMVEQTGRFENACREWRYKDDEDQTWANFQEHFTEAQADAQLAATASTAGYAGHVAEVEARQQRTDMYLANVVQDRENDKQELQELKAQVALLTDMLAKAQANSSSNQATNSGSNPANSTRKSFAERKAEANNEKRYCWTHGGMVSKNHNSATCTAPAENHKREATYDNRMGGSNRCCGV